MSRAAGPVGMVQVHKKRLQEQAELEEAERISKLPRRSKEKAKIAKVWMTTQNTRATRSKTSSSKPLNTTAKKQVGDSKKVRSKPDTAAPTTKKGTTKSRATPSSEDNAREPRGQKQTGGRIAADKQTPSAARPVFDRSRIDANDESPPIPRKAVVVKPPANRKPPVATAQQESESKKHRGRKSDKNQTNSDGNSVKSSSDSDSKSSESSLGSEEEGPRRNRRMSESDLSGEDDNYGNGSEDEDEDDSEEDEDVDENEDWAAELAADVNALGDIDEAHLDSPEFTNGSYLDRDRGRDDVGDDEYYQDQCIEEHAEEYYEEHEEDQDVQVEARGKERRSRSTSSVELPPHSGSDDDNDDDEKREAPSGATASSKHERRPLATKSAKKTSKKQKRLEERPRMRDSTSAEPAKSSGLRRHKSKIDGTTTGGRMSSNELAKRELVFHPSTHLVYNSKNGINLNSQSEKLQTLGRAIIEQFKITQAFDDAFFPIDQRFSMQREIILDVAWETSADPKIMKRLEDDDNYTSKFMQLAELRNLQFIGKIMKPHAERYIQAEYGIPVPVLPEELANRDPAVDEEEAKLRPTRERINLLLSRLAFAHSGAVLTGPTVPPVDSKKMLDRPIVSNVIRDTYFKPDGRRRPSLAACHAKLFKSSDYYRPHEKEVPESMVALACAAIAEALRSWSTGEHKTIAISSTIAEQQYDVCKNLLGTIKNEKPKRYHAVLHNLYLQATGGMPQLQEHAANKAGAVALIRFVDSDVEMSGEDLAENSGPSAANRSESVAPVDPSA